MSKKHLLLAFTLSLVLGLGWIFGKAALAHFPPVMLAAFRFGVAGAAILLFWRRPEMPLRKLFTLSLLAISVPYSLSYIGLKQLDVSVTVLLVQLEAPILVVLSAFYLKELPDRTVVLGVLAAVVGVLFVAGRPTINGQIVAVLIVVMSMLAWAIGQLAIRKLGIAGGPALLGTLSLLATPQLIAMSIILEDNHLALVRSATLIHWIQILYLGLAMTAAGVGAWYYLVARYPLHQVSPFLLLIPVVSITGGVAVLGEPLTLSTAIGGCLITLGVGIAALRREPHSDAPFDQRA